MSAIARGFLMVCVLALLMMAGASAVVAPPAPSASPAAPVPHAPTPSEAPRYTGPSLFA